MAARAEALSREHLRLTVRTLPERQALAYASSLPSNLDLMLRLAVDSPWRQRDVDAGMGRRHPRPRDRPRRGGRPAIVPPAQTNQRRSPGLRQHWRRRASASPRSRCAAFATILRSATVAFWKRLEPTRTALSGPWQSTARSSGMTSRAAASVFPKWRRRCLPTARWSGSSGIAWAATRPAIGIVYLAFVLRAGDSRPALVPLGSAAHIEGLILQWQKQLAQEAMAGGRGATRSEAAYRRVAGDLRRQIWDPLSTHLSPATRVFVVPDGALHLVSFAALPTAASQYLVETGPVIHYLSAERDLVRDGNGPAGGPGLARAGRSRLRRIRVVRRLRPRPRFVAHGRPAAISSRCSSIRFLRLYAKWTR